VSKKGSFLDNPFGGMFDFNRDGKEDFGEQWLAYKIFQECTKEDNDDADLNFDDDDFSPSTTYQWRTRVEVDYSLGVYPEHYETEEEYLEAFNEAKYAWREDCEDGYEYGMFPDDYETEDEYNEALEEATEEFGVADCNNTINLELKVSVGFSETDKLETIKESDFPNKRRYKAAYTLANDYLCYSNKERENRVKACCEFILENADTILAANYCTCDYGFIYAQAVKDNFTLPVSLPEEDEKPEYNIIEIMKKISKKDVALALQVWRWLVENFLPYSQYTPRGKEELTLHIINHFYYMPDNFKPALAHYFNDNPEFCNTIMSAHEEVASYLSNLICVCIQEELFELANRLFEYGLEKADGKWKEINELVSSIINFSKTYSELETIEYFQSAMLPLVKAIDIGMVQDEIEGWEKEIAEYVAYIEKDCEQYAYTRKNAWRKTAPDGSEYGMNPRWYNSEEEYLADLNEHKYGWRNWWTNRDTLGLDPTAFETNDEFLKAFSAQREENRRKEQEQKEKQWQNDLQRKRLEQQKAVDDGNIYTICGVSFTHASHPYHYKTNDQTIKIGDTVIVPVGDKKAEGTVISIGQYTRQAAPFPIDKIKSIISKV